MSSERLFAAFGIVSVALGIYFRFSGLGVAPLTNDEFYLVIAVDRILESGLPEFHCGGFYVRGILLQLFMVPLAKFGVDAETSVRLLPALSYVIALPALYILGRQATNRNTAIIICCIFSLSLWEIELSRFGRMYMPFQALFLWFLVILRKAWMHPTAWRPQGALILLALVSVLVWEGAVFIALLCFLPILARRSFDRHTVVHLAVVTAALYLIFSFISYDFRSPGGPENYWPSELWQAEVRGGHRPFGSLFLPIVYLAGEVIPPIWSFVLIAVLPGVWFYTGLRADPEPGSWTRNTLTLTLLVLSAANQFLLVIAGFVVGLALGILRFDNRRQFVSLVKAVLVLSGIAVSASFLSSEWLNWIAEADLGPVGNQVVVLISGLDAVRERILLIAFATFAYPFGIATFAWSWLSVMGYFVAAMILFSVAGFVRSFHSGAVNFHTYRFLFAVLVLMVLSTSVIWLGGQTRYWFFLYPLVILLGVGGIYYCTVQFMRNKEKIGASWVTLALSATLFFPSMDFSWNHLSRINEPEVYTRAIYDKEFTSHLILRRDNENAAIELANRGAPEDTIVSTQLTIGYYLHKLDYIYFGPEHAQFGNYTACTGDKDRWLDKRLLYKPSQLQEVIAKTRGSLWLIANITSPRPDEQRIVTPFLRKEIWRSVDGELSLLKIAASDSGLLNADHEAIVQ